ncbi:MAG: hypothetical protein L0Z53_16885, partial [Acidobacteriales bacterium]|nr:hypothetical protein [Terriglobales bacterium]
MPYLLWASVSWDTVVAVFSALLTPAIAIVAVYIAYQQAATNRRQHRLALFDRRMNVLNSTMKLIASIMQDAHAELDQLFQFIRDTRDHEFLFGPEVGEHINQIYRKGVELRAKNEVLKAGMRAGEERQAAIERETELLDWFAEQMAVTRKTFLKYLDFREP